jgi:hypothetical protein
LTIDGGSGGNRFNIQTTSATAVITLVGGSGGDTFRFADGASLTGNIAGAGGATLDYSAFTTSVVVNLQTGLATGVGGSVSGILNVLGGSGTPAGPGVYNLLIGTGGNTLTGGTGRRNILVAGGSASTLIAGDGEDLLIAGFTSYDSDPALANWLQVAAYWAGSDDYFTRASNLASGTGVPLLDASVVTGNGGGNVLNGSGTLALLFSDGLDTISASTRTRWRSRSPPEDCTMIAGGTDKRGNRRAAGEVLIAKQAPHRPGTAPALGLRAGSDDVSLYRRPASRRAPEPRRRSSIQETVL